MKRKLLLILVLLIGHQISEAQFLMDLLDTTTEMGKGMFAIYKKYDNIRISGYMQPQFQVATEKGAKNFNGGDFPANVNNRFMLRRGRIRFDYVHFSEKGPSIQFVFQFDGTERGVFIRDFWGRILENKFQLFTFTAGMFARPFSYELNLSSSDRESPERGRMSQLLMKTERDLGAMISFEPRKKGQFLRFIKLDAGLFNGQGLAATSDFDSRKDLITRFSLKPVPITKKLFLSIGTSYLNGGHLQNTKYVYTIKNINGYKSYVMDSSDRNVGRYAPRKYYGADIQLKLKTKAGFSELRAEFISGTQTGLKNTSETPSALLTGIEAFYIRSFNGAYFYVLHNFVSPRHQIVVKWDWYDPNTKISKKEIGLAGTNLNVSDIKYSTLGAGYNFYIHANLKLLGWYDIIKNEKTILPGYTSNIKDDIFTIRLQFRF